MILTLLKESGWLKKVLIVMFSGFLVVVGLVLLFFTFTPLPNINQVGFVGDIESIVLTDRNDNFLFNFSENKRRIRVEYENISQNITDATIAIEDKNFFSHGGIELEALLRAMLVNVQSGDFVQGGSTITQQVVKNLLLTGEKAFVRKLKEFVLAIKLEQEYSKEEILSFYFNTISYGGVIYGIGEAANSFFGKSVDKISIAEAAYLAAIPNAPTRLSPYRSNKNALEERKNYILERMAALGFITQDELRKAKNEDVYFQKQNIFSVKAPHFVFFVKNDLEKTYGDTLRNIQGETIKTTLDLELQTYTEEVVKEFAPQLDKRYGAKNAAVVIVSAKTGDILTMVGSKDYFDVDIDGEVNVTTSPRQPGSTFKPFSYAVLLQRGFTPETVLFDVPTQFSTYCMKTDIIYNEEDYNSIKLDVADKCYLPRNYDGVFRGPVSFREALAQSINVAAVKGLYIAGVTNVIDLVQSAGITTLLKGVDYGLPLVLGGGEVTPLELGSAYTIFANSGTFVPYRWSLSTPVEKRNVLPLSVAQDINDILSDNVARSPVFGANSPLRFDAYDVAVKTGTTNNSRDIWVVGYTPDIVVVVWGGNPIGDPVGGSAVGTGLALSSMFHKIMEKAAELHSSAQSRFTKNVLPRPLSPSALSGVWWDSENMPHSILHYLNKKDPVNKKPNQIDDPQYEYWEYAITEWAKNNYFVLAGKRNIYKSLIKNNSLHILKPTISTTINLSEYQTIEVLNTNQTTSRYEFYIQEKLIGSSHLPNIHFLPTSFIDGSEEVVYIRVVVYGDDGVNVVEQDYKTTSYVGRSNTESLNAGAAGSMFFENNVNENNRQFTLLSQPVPIKKIEFDF